jgi:hypothetical protein
MLRSRAAAENDPASITLTNVHHCHEAGVEYADTGYGMRGYKAPPFRKDRGDFRQPQEERLQLRHFLFGFACGKAEAVSVKWPRADIPKLDQILRGDIDVTTISQDVVQSLERDGVMGMEPINGPDQYIGVREAVH